MFPVALGRFIYWAPVLELLKIFAQNLYRYIYHRNDSNSACIIHFITRHSLVRAKGEVLVLLCFFVRFFCQRFLDNTRADSRQILYAGILWFPMCLLPFWGLVAPRGMEKGGNEIFVTIGVNGEFWRK